MIAGVAGGVAEMLDADPSIIRIVWALLVFLTGGISLLVYIVMAIVVPLVRMYVAAHLPLDLIGGAALGVTVASAVNLLFGVPIRAQAETSRAGPT